MSIITSHFAEKKTQSRWNSYTASFLYIIGQWLISEIEVNAIGFDRRGSQIDFSYPTLQIRKERQKLQNSTCASRPKSDMN
jgi:hypothetical protein